MDIRITSVVDERFSERFRELTVRLEDSIRPTFESLEFGADINQFVIVFIAVGSDKENKTFFDEHNKVSVYKDFVTKEKIKFISFAILIDTKDIETGKFNVCYEELVNLIGEKFTSHSLKIPQGFYFQDFKDKFLKHLR